MEAAPALATDAESQAAQARRWLDRFLELDFTQPFAFAALALAFVGSRLYWLDHGYGTDPDAWRVALTADYLWETGDYLPSRLPGYPLHEFVTAAVIKGGWVWTNLTTVLISLVGVYLFATLAKKLDIANAGALTIGFAFAPLLWINSAMTMDYMWALTFIMGAYLALLYRNAPLAGLLLGLAAGFRITSLFMLVPFWLLLWRTHERGMARPLTLTAIAVTMLAFTPVLMRYGLAFLNFYDEPVRAGEFVKRLGKDGLGVIGSLALVMALAVSLPRLRALPKDLAENPHVLVWTATVLIFFFSYMRLPHEIAYLIPLFPFGFFLLSRYMSRAVLVPLLVVIVAAGFIDVTSADDDIGLSPSTFTSAGIGRGMLLSDLDTLDGQMNYARELRDLSANNPNIRQPAVVAAGFIYPELVVLYKDDLEISTLEDDLEAISQLSDKGEACDPNCNRPAITYVWLLEYEDFRGFAEQGKTIYLTPDAARSTYAVYDYRPGYFGGIELPFARKGAPWAGGAATTDR
jgi:hypothetical protein